MGLKELIRQYGELKRLVFPILNAEERILPLYTISRSVGKFSKGDGVYLDDEGYLYIKRGLRSLTILASNPTTYYKQCKHFNKKVRAERAFDKALENMENFLEGYSYL